MKISLITSSFNSESTIRATLESVCQQDYDNLEYIIVDGGSSDETMEIVRSFSDCVDVSISEQDKGIYDALNKGIKLATGDVVGFLHSDDFFPNNHTISSIAEQLKRAGTDALYGDLDYVDRSNPQRVIRKWRSRPYEERLFYRGWMPAHPTFYLKRACYENFGGYDTSYRQSADYELMLRMLMKYKVSVTYLPEVLVKMRVGGASNVSLKNRWRANQEDAKAWVKNGLKPKPYTRFAKPLSKLTQFLG